jgi:hypothetical protein
LLASLSTEDRKIYNASFEKSINVDLGGDPAAYATMLERCGALKAECEFVQVDKQPTSDLIPLVLMVREEIPAYKAIVQGVVAQAAAASGATAPTTIYRPGDQTKSPYRMVEKALTKGPNREYPDCSQILDVFGCIIECQDYVAMAAVVDAFAQQHNCEAISIARIKDRWNAPSEGGWRDLMLNIVVNSVVFEVQVVLQAMYTARTAMKAHLAYNQFRSFAEVFGLLELSMEVCGGMEGTPPCRREEEGENEATKGEETSCWCCDGGSATATRISELEAEVAKLTADKARADRQNVELETENAEWARNAEWLDDQQRMTEKRMAALLTTRAADVAQLEAERDADRQQFEAKVAQLQAQLTARE